MSKYKKREKYMGIGKLMFRKKKKDSHVSK